MRGFNYHPPRKFQEGNVFSPVCLSAGESHVIITHNALNLTIQGPLPQTCALPSLQGLPDMFKLNHFEACTVGKRAVGILLEDYKDCLLISCHKEV